MAFVRAEVRTVNLTIEAAAPVAVAAEVVLEEAQLREVGRMQQQRLMLEQEVAGATTRRTTFGVTLVRLATAITNAGSSFVSTMRMRNGQPQWERTRQRLKLPLKTKLKPRIFIAGTTSCINNSIHITNGGSGANGCNTKGKWCVATAVALAAALLLVISALAMAVVVIALAETTTVAGADLAMAAVARTAAVIPKKTAATVKWRR